MERSFMERVAQFLSSQQRRKRWYRILTGLAAVVVFCTTYALILPALTISNEMLCGMEAHEHTSACYMTQMLNAQPEIICEPGSEGEIVLHLHNKYCYDGTGKLICQLEELEPHIHGPECYQERQDLICEEPQDLGHTHEPSCYSRVRGELICGHEENTAPSEGHVHDESCYEERVERTLTCGLEETTPPAEDGEEAAEGAEPLAEGHVHSDACYEEMVERVLVCELPEEEPGEEHVHSDECYAWEETLVCGEEEREPGHVHGDGCFDIIRTLTCMEQELIPHVHDESCYTYYEDENGETQAELVCELPVVIEHNHTQECVYLAETGPMEAQVLICGMQEHVHVDSCFMDLSGADENGFYCGLSEHLHTQEECYFESGELRCTIPEHAHTAACLTPPEKPEEPEETDGPDGVQTPETPQGVMLEDSSYTVNYQGFEVTFHVSGYAALTEEAAETPVVPPEEEPSWLDGILEPQEPVDDGPDASQQPETPSRPNDSTSSSANDTPSRPNNDAPSSVTPPPAQEDTEPPQQSTGEPAEDEGGMPSWILPNEPDGDTQEPEQPATGSSQPEESGPPSWLTGDSSEPAQDNEEGAKDLVPDWLGVGFAATADDLDLPTAAAAEDNIPDSGVPDGPVQDDAVPDAGVPAGDAPENNFPEDNAPETGADVPENSENPNEPNGGEGLPAAPEGDLPENGEVANTMLDPEDVTFAVLPLESGEEYEAIQARAREMDETEEGDLLLMEVLGLSASANGFKLDLSQCEVTAEIRPSQELVDALEETSAIMFAGEELPEEEIPEVEPVVALTAFTGDGELDSMELTTESAASCLSVPVRRSAVAFSARNTANPSFTVQYYANLDRVKTNPGTGVQDPFNPTIIDTSGANGLPQNGNLNTGATKILLTENTHVKNRYGHEMYKVQVDRDVETEIYASRTYSYINHPGLRYFDIVSKAESYDSASYDLTTIRVSNDGGGTWTDYPLANYKNASGESTLHFTNRVNDPPVDPGHTYIPIRDGAIIRLVYDTQETTKTFNASFYDYNIASKVDYGTPAGGFTMHTKEAGINSSSNYSGTGTKFAFGNGNGSGATGLGSLSWNGQMLNQANASSFGNCTFGLVTGMNADRSDVQFANGIIAPNLFSGGTATGKASVSEVNELNFIRNGDTYTLSSVSNTDAKNLEYLWMRGNWNNTKYIWSNSFWPLDKINGTDPWFGDASKGNLRKVEGMIPKEKEPLEVVEGERSAPTSDEGNFDHNAYFGMHFGVAFSLTKDYKGPLEYYFFGDDDMWVFLTDTVTGENKLVCDIGGVHGSVGEYVDLWDYINEADLVNNDENNPHRYELRFFYTERGASGSACWMQFTLPSVVSLDITQVQSNGALKIEKKIEGVSDEAALDKEFEFELRLQRSKDDTGYLYDDYSYVRYGYLRDENGQLIRDENGQKIFGELERDLLIRDGNLFTLRGDEYILIEALPEGAYYTITEVTQDPVFQPSNQVNDGTIVANRTAEGEISQTQNNNVTFINTATYALPETGSGPNSCLYTFGGLLLIGASILWYRKREYGEEVVD